MLMSMYLQSSAYDQSFSLHIYWLCKLSACFLQPIHVNLRLTNINLSSISIMEFVRLLVSLSHNISLHLGLVLGLRKPLLLNLLLFVVCCLSNHKSTTSRQPRKLKFCMPSYFNPTKWNMKKNIGVTNIKKFRKSGYP